MKRAGNARSPKMLVIKIALIAFGISPTLTLGVALVARAVPRNAIVKAYSLGASTAAVVVKGILPQIVPQIVEMIRLAVGPAWIYLIAAEYVNASEGIGHGIVLSMRMVRIDHNLEEALYVGTRLLVLARDPANPAAGSRVAIDQAIRQSAPLDSPETQELLAHVRHAGFTH